MVIVELRSRAGSVIAFTWFDNYRYLYHISKPRSYKTCFMLNSADHEIYPAHKYQNANNCWHYNIYKHD